MSENTQNGAVAEIDADQFAAFQAFQEKQRQAKIKADARAAERKRSNNRPVDATGEEMPAGQGFVKIAGDYLEDVIRVFRNDPDGLVSRLTEDYLPALRNVSNAPRLSQAAAYDQNRKVLVAHMPPEGTVPVPAPSKK